MVEEKLILRRMSRSDIDAVLALDRKVGGGQNKITHRDMAATDPGGALDLSLVAELGGQVVGFILARMTYISIPFTEVCLIHSIVVDNDYRRHQIGSRLVSELSSLCHAEGISTVRALVNERDASLRRFVDHLGFHRSGTINYDKTIEN